MARTQKKPAAAGRRSREPVPHDARVCLLCSRNARLMRVECVADYLGLAQITIYSGAGGTKCLYERRIKQGSNVRWLRTRVVAHRRAQEDFGECNGRCKEASVDEVAPESILRIAG